MPYDTLSSGAIVAPDMTAYYQEAERIIGLAQAAATSPKLTVGDQFQVIVSVEVEDIAIFSLALASLTQTKPNSGLRYGSVQPINVAAGSVVCTFTKIMPFTKGRITKLLPSLLDQTAREVVQQTMKATHLADEHFDAYNVFVAKRTLNRLDRAELRRTIDRLLETETRSHAYRPFVGGMPKRGNCITMIIHQMD